MKACSLCGGIEKPTKLVSGDYICSDCENYWQGYASGEQFGEKKGYDKGFEAGKKLIEGRVQKMLRNWWGSVEDDEY